MKNKDIIERTFIFSWPYAIIFSLVLYLITKNFDDVLSFLLGVLTSLFVNSLNYRMMKTTYQYQPDKIKVRQIWLFIGKYAFMGLILYVAITSESYNEYLTLVGLLTFVIISVPTAIIFSKRGDSEDE